MAVVNAFLVGAFITIIPAMSALWYFLKRYEDYFDDRRLFFALVTGFFAGLVATAFELNAFPFADQRFVDAMGVGTAFLFFVLGYAFFETGAKVMVLGLKRFRQRKDTPYYGLALGLGFGAMAALMFVALNVRIAEDTGHPYNLVSFLLMASVPVGAILVHGATGVYAGKGSTEGRLWKGWGIGTLLQIPVLGAYWLFWPTIGAGDRGALFPAFLALAYGIALLVITRDRVLDRIVPPQIRAQLRREKRAAALAKRRGITGPDEEE